MPIEKNIPIILFIILLFFKTDQLKAQNWNFTSTHFAKEKVVTSYIFDHVINDNDSWTETGARLVRFLDILEDKDSAVLWPISSSFYDINKNLCTFSLGNRLLDILKVQTILKLYFGEKIWLKLISILFILIFIYLIFKWQIQKVKNHELKLREKDTKIHQLELSVWRSKINPHFLFNSLNSIVALINMNKYENAVEYINDFSIVLRKTIQSSDKLFNIINEEIILIESLLKLEMMKRENKFYFSIKLGSPDIKYLFFPTLLIQPVIENSLKHGIKSNPNGKILISFYEHRDKIICTVEDNGDGIIDKVIKNTSHRSMGINLIKDKIKIIEEIIHDKIEFIFKNKTDINNTGTITIFVLPKITKEKYVKYNNS